MKPPLLVEYAPRIAHLRQRLSPPPAVPPGGVLVTVVTVVFNGARTIEACIDSVRSQTHPWIEHLVIDGGSTDGTVAILERRADQLAGWVSEPDDGIADAFNKGLALARGSVIGILNADDRYLPHTVAAALAGLDEARSAAWAYGGCDFLLDGAVVLHHDGDRGYARLIRKRMPVVNHPTVFVRQSAYAAAGVFRTDLRLAMDYDLLLRFELAGLHGVCIPRTQALMALGGVSTRRSLSALAEASRIAVEHGRPRILATFELLVCLAKPLARHIATRLGLRTAWLAIRPRRRRAPDRRAR